LNVRLRYSSEGVGEPEKARGRLRRPLAVRAVFKNKRFLTIANFWALSLHWCSLLYEAVWFSPSTKKLLQKC